MNLDALLRHVGPVDGRYLRPFVADGDPAECKLVLLGYNPATAIYEANVPRERYAQLLLDRTGFEAVYGEVRRRAKIDAGKTNFLPVSTTRRRLGLIRRAFEGVRTADMNLNCLPNQEPYRIPTFVTGSQAHGCRRGALGGAAVSSRAGRDLRSRYGCVR